MNFSEKTDWLMRLCRTAVKPQSPSGPPRPAATRAAALAWIEVLEEYAGTQDPSALFASVSDLRDETEALVLTGSQLEYELNMMTKMWADEAFGVDGRAAI
jgi:hypothetical protein